MNGEILNLEAIEKKYNAYIIAIMIILIITLLILVIYTGLK